MEPKDNENCTQEYQREENPNPPQPPNIKTQINDELATFRLLVHELMGTT
jgi:hypothetical protein